LWKTSRATVTAAVWPLAPRAQQPTMPAAGLPVVVDPLPAMRRPLPAYYWQVNFFPRDNLKLRPLTIMCVQMNFYSWSGKN